MTARHDAGWATPAVFWSTRFLRSLGMSERDLCRAVRDGRLLRPRRGRYLASDTHPRIVKAVAAGGRLDCVSLLALHRVFVFTSEVDHVAVVSDASRLPPCPPHTVRHWRDDGDGGECATSSLIAAVVQAVRCQQPRHAVATLDSALHLGILAVDDLAEVFRRLPRRFAPLRRLVDPRAESGTETLVRLMLRALGAQCEIQARIDGVGRVDFVVDGWLIVECDSREHHSTWSDHVRDRRRDLVAAGLGYTTVRLLAEDILYRPESVVAALRTALTHRVGNSGCTHRQRVRSA